MSAASALVAERASSAAQGGGARLFAGAAYRYWTGVFPVARAAQRRHLSRAEAIPDPRLRADALASHRDKGSNSEGLAAMAVLAPAARRPAVVRSLVAYQLILDYLDGVSERPDDDPLANGHALHRAFEVALDPDAQHEAYYSRAALSEDGGYLRELIDICREPLAALPSFSAVRPSLQRQARLCRESQALNHALGSVSVQEEVAAWAARIAAETALEPGFEWWELIAAAAASSLCVGALLALAGAPGVREDEALAVESAYFPWASGLNALLDSLVDFDEDPAEASHLRRYGSGARATERVGTIADGARRRLAELPNGRLHEAILAGMGSLYLVDEKAWQADRAPTSLAVFDALGPFAQPALAVHLMRRPRRGSRAVLAAMRHRRGTVK